MDAKKFGAFIAAMRKEKNMTQMDLARKLQVTDKAVSKWERGLGFPDIICIFSYFTSLLFLLPHLYTCNPERKTTSKSKVLLFISH